MSWGVWVVHRCCGSRAHYDLAQPPSSGQVEALRAGPCFGCRERQQRIERERADGTLVDCSLHGEKGLCYPLDDGTHANIERCRCRFRFFDDCPVAAHRSVATTRDAGWNERRRREWREGGEKTSDIVETPEPVSEQLPADWARDVEAGLVGSQMQVRWAKALRTRLLDAVRRYVDERDKLLAYQQQTGRTKASPQYLRERDAGKRTLVALKRVTLASWWIDHRFDSVEQLIEFVERTRARLDAVARRERRDE